MWSEKELIPVIMDTLKTLLESGKLKTSYLEVQIVKRIEKDRFIVADGSKVAVLDTSETVGQGKNLTDGCWYKLIKCSKGEENHVVKNHRTFKPVKLAMRKNLGDIDSLVKEIETQIEKMSKKNEYIDFEMIEERENNTRIEEVTVMVMSKSRIISTNRGNYQICTIKDYKGNKTSINLYSKFIDHLEPLKIYKLVNIRKADITKNEKTEMRLHTTGFTRIGPSTEEDWNKFEDVKIADDVIEGKLIGVGDITSYNSCKLHYTKLSEEDECAKCMKYLKDADIQRDYRLELYVEDKGVNVDSDADVVEILIFKRNVPTEYRDNIEEKVEALLNQDMRIDYNIDDANRKIAVSVKLIE